MQKNQCLQYQILENPQKYYPLVVFIDKYQFLSTNNLYQSLSSRWNQLLLNFKIKRQRYPLLSIKKTRKKIIEPTAACVTLTRRYLFQFQQHQYQHADSFAMSMASCAVVFFCFFGVLSGIQRSANDDVMGLQSAFTQPKYSPNCDGVCATV